MALDEKTGISIKLILVTLLYGAVGAWWLFINFLFFVMGAGSGMGSSFFEIVANWALVIFMFSLPSFLIISIPIAWYFYFRENYQKVKWALIFSPGITAVLVVIMLFWIIFRGFLEGIGIL